MQNLFDSNGCVRVIWPHFTIGRANGVGCALRDSLDRRTLIRFVFSVDTRCYHLKGNILYFHYETMLAFPPISSAKAIRVI